VADDDPTVLELMTEILSRTGCEVVTEANGDGAIARVKEQPFDLVFLDIRMPISGLTAVEQILRLRPDTRIVMITGEKDLSQSEKAIALGARMVLMKPFSVSVALDTTDMLLAETGR
jgi:CheY-like chemotaxis protein